MKKYIILGIVLVLIFGACEKSLKNNDGEAPQIKYMSFNRYDTIFDKLGTQITPEGDPVEIVDTILVNIRPDITRKDFEPFPIESIPIDESDVDTIVLGGKLLISAHFTDDVALGFFKIDLAPAKDNEGKEDDIVEYMTRVRAISNVNDTIVKRYRDVTVLTDSISVTDENGNSKKKPVRAGAYTVDIYCMDAAGNETAIRKKVMMVHRQDVIDSRNKRPL